MGSNSFPVCLLHYKEGNKHSVLQAIKQFIHLFLFCSSSMFSVMSSSLFFLPECLCHERNLYHLVPILLVNNIWKWQTAYMAFWKYSHCFTSSTFGPVTALFQNVLHSFFTLKKFYTVLDNDKVNKDCLKFVHLISCNLINAVYASFHSLISDTHNWAQVYPVSSDHLSDVTTSWLQSLSWVMSSNSLLGGQAVSKTASLT